MSGAAPPPNAASSAGTDTGADAWADAALAARLFAVDPAGTGGVALRALAGPVRDHWLGAVRALLPEGAPLRRVPVGITDERLLGGLDLTATLRAGRPVAERGVLALADGGAVVLAMAERLPTGTAARVAAALDLGEVPVMRDGLSRRDPARIGVIALDEGAAADERTPPALLDRLAFHIDLAEVSHRDAGNIPDEPGTVAAARARLRSVAAGEEIAEALCTAALALGIASIRAPLLALRVACASAALAGRDAVSQRDAAVAARLVLAPRATVLPEALAPAQDAGQDTADAPPDTTEQDQPGNDGLDNDGAGADQPLGEIVLEAAQASIPAGLLAQLRAQEIGRARAGAAGHAGALRPAGQRGRPVGVRAGSPRDGLRLSVIETLRAAAPWQRLRAAANPAGPARIRIAREDVRVARLKQRAETTTVFIVDASGSSAAGRLAEAKGAVELLLAECYVRRDQVAVLAFRGRAAQVVLPPTRSLTRAKRSLAGLPGGGGTPLAAGIDAGAALADSVRRRGGTPSIVLLTDGRANVARDVAGQNGATQNGGGRARAEQDAADAARRLRAAGFACLLVDTSPRPSPAGPRLAADLGARYLALPYAGAAALSTAIRAAPRAS